MFCTIRRKSPWNTSLPFPPPPPPPGCAWVSSTLAVFTPFAESPLISGWGWAAQCELQAVPCIGEQWGVRGRRVLLWAHSLAPQSRKDFFVEKHREHGWDLFGAQLGRGWPWGSGLHGRCLSPGFCRMTVTLFLFSCFAVRRFLFCPKDYFFFLFSHSLHLHNRLSSFLLSLLICRLANTFISTLGVGHPSVLRVSHTRAAAGWATVLFQYLMVFPTDPAADPAYLSRSCSWVSYSRISL